MTSRWLERARHWQRAWRGSGTEPRRDGTAAAEAPPTTEARSGFIAVIVDGFGSDEIAQILDTVERTSAAAGLRPVVITHGCDLRVYRRRGLPVEVLADPPRQPASLRNLPWQQLRQAQLRAIVRLWQPVAAASFARPADPELLAGLRRAIAQPSGA
jgi:hypothetical protein